MKDECSHRYKNGELAKWFQNLQFGEPFIACFICGENISEIIEEENRKLIEKLLTNANNNGIILL